MLPKTFISILKAFADNPDEIDITNDQLIFEVHDDLVEIILTRDNDHLKVTENGQSVYAEEWITKRLAKLQLLATRILDNIPTLEAYVSPTGTFLDDLTTNPNDEEEPISDVLEQTLEWIDRGSTLMSRVLYLTSDAGEGKTTTINYAARIQAQRFINGTSGWLLVPISLGGRPFLQLDEVILGTLGRRFRFQFLYYDAILELVRLGKIVLALDGFEEMFVEGSAGDAVSSLGNLMSNLDSQGTVVIAARKAYFEYKSLDTTAKLFDTLRDVYVDFGRIRIDRWDEQKFVEYCEKNKVPDGLAVHRRLVTALGDASHPLITRPVLVRHLVNSIMASDSALEQIVGAIGPNDKDYYYQFVRSIIDREATEKWIDKSGEPYGPLISVDQHFDLLSFVAEEMWTGETETLKPEFLELAAGQFCETQRLSSRLTEQVKERIKTHALILASDEKRSGFSFDHQEFFHFFLGLAIAREIQQGRNADGLLPILCSSCYESLNSLRRRGDF